MCIRDSTDSVHRGVGDTDRPVLGEGQGADRVEIGVGDVHPVSYTHLRAHETVLDLVCRLLLEKKQIREHASQHMAILWNEM